jgi:DNA-binding transcriptional LysR family regulator
MLLDIVVLRTFVAVVEAKGFTRAAAFVNLTQSAVSLHIKRLEEQVGRRLFDRTASKLALTSDGEILLSYAQRILALEEEEVKTRLGHPEPEGLVRFGAPEYLIRERWHPCWPSLTAAIRQSTLKSRWASGPTSPLCTDAACSTSQS